MQPTSVQDYKKLLTDVIKKQIVILGPDITLSKARNVKGLTVSDDGTVTDVVGEPQIVTQALIDQFVQLSGLIVKKTMEPLLSLSTTPTPQSPQTPMQNTTSVEPTMPTIQSTSLPNPQTTTPIAPTQSIQPSTTHPTNTTQDPTPTDNPLAA